MGSGEGGQRERGRGRLGDANRKQKREDTFVSPAIKWLMFSFNMFFWVNIICTYSPLYFWLFNHISVSVHFSVNYTM